MLLKNLFFRSDKFPNVNKELGPEMKSTGEAIYFIKRFGLILTRNLYKEKSMFLRDN